MEATLHIYANCTDEKPIKTYTARRLTFGVSIKAQSLDEKMKGKTDAEALEFLLDFFQSIFPDFTSEDLNGVDPAEITQFVNEIGKAATNKFERAQKN